MLWVSIDLIPALSSAYMLKNLCGSVFTGAIVELFLGRSSGNSRSNWKSSVNDVRRRNWRPSRRRIKMNTVLLLLMKLNGG
jgi:hypothetical protein